MAAVEEEQRASRGDLCWRLGRWTVMPARNRIARNGDEKKLEPKVMRVLEVLLERAGEVVSRREIENAVWPNAVIGEKTLTRAISELRRAFEDDVGEPAVIETVARRGYRLMPEAIPFTVGARAARLRYLAAAAPVVLLAMWWFGRPAGVDDTTIGPTRKLTSFAGLELTPAPSPNGELVAYARQADGEETTSLFVSPIAGGSELRLTGASQHDIAPAWSPDGAMLAYLSYREGGCEIRSVGALGGEPRTLAECALTPARPNFAPTLDWSPDGGQLAFVDREKARRVACLRILDIAAGDVRTIGADAEGRCKNDMDPAFSPDGTRLAFTRVIRGGIADLHVFDLTDESARRLTRDHRSILGSDWISDDEITFSSDRSGTYRLWRIAAAGGVPRWLPADGRNIKRPRLNENGVIAYEDWLYDMNIWTAAADGGGVDRLIASTVWDFHPAPSPEGWRLAFVSNRSGNFELWLRDTDGSERALTRSANRVVGFPAWDSPGDVIAYVLQSGDRLAIAAVDLQGREVLRIAVEGNAVAPSWTGDAIVYGSDAGGIWQIYSRDIESGETERLTDDGGYRGVRARNGTLYFTRAGESGLWRRDVNGSTAMFNTNLAAHHWADWQLIGDALIIPDAESRDLLIVDAESGEVRRAIVTPGYNSANAKSHQLSPDLRTLYWAQLDTTDADVVTGRIVLRSRSDGATD